MIRSMLFLPGNKPNILIHGEELGADAVIYDLEDSVAPDQKDAARTLVRNTLRYTRPHGCEVIVRVNALDSPYWQQDLEALIPLRPDYIMPPKVTGPEVVKTLDSAITNLEKKHELPEGGIGLVLLIETALGVENAYLSASAAKRVKAIFLGGEDLSADLGCKRTKEGNEIDYARKRMVCAAKAAAVDVYDTPFTDVNDDEGIRADAEYAKSLGFTGKSSIAPRHISVINEVFSPTAADIEYAYEVIDAITDAKKRGAGVVALRGKMIDAPVEKRALRTIQIVEAICGRQGTMHGLNGDAWQNDRRLRPVSDRNHEGLRPQKGEHHG